MKKTLFTGLLLTIPLIAVWLIFQSGNNNTNSTNQKSGSNNVTKNETSTTTSNPLAIENLKKRSYQGSEITVEQTFSENSLYKAYRVSYLSDGLKIFAAMNVPNGTGPFPVIILNHGYFNTTTFNTGDGTKTMADILANNGYLTLASDYRNHGESESDGVQRGHRPEYSVDVLNLIASVNNLEKADQSKIGTWGHSMGGEVALKVLEVSEQIKAAVLWAPTSGNSRRNFEHWVLRFGENTTQPQENSSTNSPEKQTFDETSANNYFDYISAPIQLHHGTADAEVPYDWSVELNSSLENAGKNIEFFTYEGQDHNFRNYGWGEISPRTIEFFDLYLK